MEIDNTAYELRKKLNKDLFGPFNVYECTNNLNIKIVYGKFKNATTSKKVSVALGINYPLYINKGFTKLIVLNKKHIDKSYQRYATVYLTISLLINYEEGKYFKDVFTNEDYLNMDNRIANLTRSILIPIEECYELYRKYRVKGYSEELIILKLSSYYKVPIEVTSYRLNEIKKLLEIKKQTTNIDNYNGKYLKENQNTKYRKILQKKKY